MANIFMMNKEIARGMVCFFHQKKHSYLIFLLYKCHNQKFVYTSGRPQLSTIRQKSKQMSYLDICFPSTYEPDSGFNTCFFGEKG
jgi:hypothetical protein